MSHAPTATAFLALRACPADPVTLLRRPSPPLATPIAAAAPPHARSTTDLASLPMGKLTATSWFRARLATKPPLPSSAAASDKAAIGVLAFEVAGLMSKASHLWRSLSDDRIARLRDGALRLPGVRKLVSDDDDLLISLALAEFTSSLSSLSRSLARLAARCSDPALRRFDLAFADLVKTGADPYNLLHPTPREMDRAARKMDRLATASAGLYQELEVLAELEQALLRRTPRGGAAASPHRVAWQRREVKRLREASLWGRSYDYAVRLLARSLFTIAARIKHVFGFDHEAAAAANSSTSAVILHRSQSATALIHPSDGNTLARFYSGPLLRSGTRSGPVGRAAGGPCTPRRRVYSSKSKWPVSVGPFGECMTGGNGPPVLDSCILRDSVAGRQMRPSSVPGIVNGVEEARSGSAMDLSMYLFDSKCKLLNAPPSTLGAAALALHYANVIIVIEKFVATPHLIGPDARDDLYQMLPTSIRAALRARLRSYAKNLATSVFDPVLASEWTEAVTRILEWMAPLAHNMIKWQSERNFEQQHLISSANVLLLQTLYFANQAKTEAAITELLVGLNYMWRFGRELNTRAVNECAGSRNYDDCLDSNC